MGKFVSPGSSVAVVAGMLNTEDHRKKTDGFSQAFPQHCAGGKIFTVIEGHEDEDESFQKTYDLLRRAPDLAGLYVNTVNCLPVCRALGAHGLAGKVRLITTDLFAEMAPYFHKGIITASIYQQPHRQGQIAVRLMADHLISKVPFPPTIYLSPGVVMSSNLNLFREMRLAEVKFDESALRDRVNDGFLVVYAERHVSRRVPACDAVFLKHSAQRFGSRLVFYHVTDEYVVSHQRSRLRATRRGDGTQDSTIGPG